jgi:tripartite ATP-independent transporter DctM subunit
MPLILIFAVVVGDMTRGWATPTEAAALGAAATIIAAALYRSLTVDNLMTALRGTVAVSGTILFIIVGATTFSQVLSFSGATNGVISLVGAQGLPPWAMILGMMGLLIVLGFFIDEVSMMMITLPFFMPLVQQMGVDLVWFGVLFLINMQIGLLSPPFGLLLFAMKGAAPPHITMAQIVQSVLPYLYFGIAVMLLVFLVPSLATWLPRLLGG